jgi:two-component system LytT family sensor kinase
MLLVQPLAENAVNHGVRRNVNGGTVVIAARVEGDDLCVSVRDDGPGWYEGSTGTGFGLKSVRRRLQLVYGNNAELRIDKSHGVSVHMRIPLGC